MLWSDILFSDKWSKTTTRRSCKGSRSCESWGIKNGNIWVRQLQLQLKLVWTCVTTLFVLITHGSVALSVPLQCQHWAEVSHILCSPYLYVLLCITLLYFLYHASQTLHTVGSLCACFLVSGASFCLLCIPCVSAPVFRYICVFHLLHFVMFCLY